MNGSLIIAFLLALENTKACYSTAADFDTAAAALYGGDVDVLENLYECAKRNCKTSANSGYKKNACDFVAAVKSPGACSIQSNFGNNATKIDITLKPYVP